MNKNIIRTKLNNIFSENILLIIFSIFVINKNFVFSVLNFNPTFLMIRKTVLYSLYVILLIKLVIDFFVKPKKIGVAWIVFIMLSGIITIVTRDMELPVLILIILSLKDIKFDKIINTCFYSNLFATAFIILLSICGVLENWVYKIGNQVQNSLGYNYSTIPATYLFLLVLMRFYIKKSDIKVYEIIINIVLAVVMYYYTCSLTGCGLIIVISAIEIIYKILKNSKKTGLKKILNNNIIKGMIKVIPIFLILLSVVSAFIYDENNETWVKTNLILSNRIVLANRAIKNYGIPIFGKKITWVGNGGRGYVELSSNEYNFVDNAYMRIIFDKGIIYFIVLLGLLIFYQNILIENKKYYAIIIEIILIAWAVAEPNILKIENNIFLIPFFVTTLNKLKIKYEEKTNEKDSKEKFYL